MGCGSQFCNVALHSSREMCKLSSLQAEEHPSFGAFLTKKSITRTSLAIAQTHRDEFSFHRNASRHFHVQQSFEWLELSRTRDSKAR